MVLATVFQLSYRTASARRPSLTAARLALSRAERTIRESSGLARSPLYVLPTPLPVPSASLPPAPISKVRLAELPSEEQLLQEINGCKTLLLEIVRRAAYDWVLYRSSRRLVQVALAEQAHNWLFVEEPGTDEWASRMEDAKYITSFLGICESLDLDPGVVRGHIRRLTPKNVVSVGRPAEYRQRDVFSSHEHTDGAYALPAGVDVDALAGSEEDNSVF